MDQITRLGVLVALGRGLGAEPGTGDRVDPADPGALVLVAGAEALYLRALRVLRARGVAVPRGQIVLWHLGIALWVIGFFSPLHALSDDLLSTAWGSMDRYHLAWLMVGKPKEIVRGRPMTPDEEQQVFDEFMNLGRILQARQL